MVPFFKGLDVPVIFTLYTRKLRKGKKLSVGLINHQ